MTPTTTTKTNNPTPTHYLSPPLSTPHPSPPSPTSTNTNLSARPPVNPADTLNTPTHLVPYLPTYPPTYRLTAHPYGQQPRREPRYDWPRGRPCCGRKRGTTGRLWLSSGPWLWRWRASWRASWRWLWVRFWGMGSSWRVSCSSSGGIAVLVRPRVWWRSIGLCWRGGWFWGPWL